MSKIRIKNFGPIREGYQENDGWIEIKKVTVFIGNQGSGKSTVAKLISTFTWIEKALIRGDVNAQMSHKELRELLRFHRLEDYLETGSEIEYEGATYRIYLTKNKDSDTHFIAANKLNNKAVKLPKIMYVPAERNFLSSIENINKVSNLIVGSLQNYSVEFRNAQLANKGNEIELPINKAKVLYDANEDENYLLFGDNKRLKLADASSGFHSIVPLYWVTRYLIDFVKQGEKILLTTLSTDQNIRRNVELKKLNNQDLTAKEIKAKEKKINEKYVCSYFVNIVEEPEQNLFPSSQELLLNSLLAFNNGNNMLIMTTHSPYLINYLSIAMQGAYVHGQIVKKGNANDLLEKLKAVVPLNSTVSADDVVVYELNEDTGTLSKLDNSEGVLSDKNLLNKSIRHGNQMFDSLLEIEEEL